MKLIACENEERIASCSACLQFGRRGRVEVRSEINEIGDGYRTIEAEVAGERRKHQDRAVKVCQRSTLRRLLTTSGDLRAKMMISGLPREIAILRQQRR